MALVPEPQNRSFIPLHEARDALANYHAIKSTEAGRRANSRNLLWPHNWLMVVVDSLEQARHEALAEVNAFAARSSSRR